MQTIDIEGEGEDMAGQLMDAVKTACDCSMSRCGVFTGHRPVYWWNDEIAKARQHCPRKPKGALSTKVRPDALVIKTVGEVTYADLLRKVKQDEKLHGLGEAVSRIRRTQQGELLLQLNISGEDTSAFRTLIGETLGETAEIRSLSHRVTIECKDLDEITTAKDIVDALRSQMEITDAAVDDINLRKGYGGTQTASIRLPAESARKALSAGLLKVGWVRCRLRERVNITKCYRCLEFGHLARHGRSEVDRSKMCRRCGKYGHLAKDCKEEPQCMFCKDKGSDWKHIAGSERQNQRRPNKSGPKWKDRFLDADTFSHVFNVAEWNPAGTSVDDMARQLSERLDAACDSSMPRRKPSRRGSPCYWWNDQIARRCSQRARRRPDFEDRLEDLRAAKRALKHAIKASFRKYLHKYRHEDSPECPTCPSASEDPEHVLYYCTRYRGRAGVVPPPESLMAFMLATEDNWSSTSQLIIGIQRDLRRCERERRERSDA
ncbi:hypothetical protein ACLKA7_000744 [Drosophila subpalustris]